MNSFCFVSSIIRKIFHFIAGDATQVEQLLERHADVNLVDNVGSNPLHRAAETGI